jgi:acetoin utilization deacetylase AcuC-like enzyme
MTRGLLEIARRHADGRLVSVLEGGYDLDALARSAEAHVEELVAGA